MSLYIDQLLTMQQDILEHLYHDLEDNENADYKLLSGLSAVMLCIMVIGPIVLKFVYTLTTASQKHSASLVKR